jgi:glycosyltransferase involved in cell wall biosynthesis
MPDSNVAIVHNKLRNYRSPFFEKISDKYNADLFVFDHYSSSTGTLSPKNISSFRLIRELWDNDYDVVFVSDIVFSQTWIVLLLSRFFNYKTVVLSEIWEKPHTPLATHFKKKIAAMISSVFIDSILSPTKKTQSYFSDHTLLNKEDVFVAPNAHEMPSPPSSEQYDDDSFTVLYVGRLVPLKRVEDVIDAFDSANIFNSHLLIAGSGEEPYITDLRSKAEGIGGVKFLGWIEDESKLADLYFRADVCILPSLRDSAPLVATEAMSLGTPMIVSKGVGVADELVIDGKTGFVVSTKSPREIADAIELLYNNPYLKELMGSQSKDLIQERVSYEIMFDKFEKALEHSKAN